MSEPAVLYSRDQHVGVVTLNRPDNRNSMTAEVLDAFRDVVARVRADGELRAVVVTGRGTCFSSGADFRSIVQRDDGPRPLLPPERSYAMYEPFLSVNDIEVPVIGALQGHAVGGGFGLALACDLRVAARGSRYGANFARLGLAPGLAISWVLPRLVGVPRAAEMLFTGRLVDGDEAARIGLVNESVDADAVQARALELARAIAANAPIAVRAMKRLLYRGVGWDPRSAAWDEACIQAATLGTEDVQEGIAALLEKRDPVFHGR
jgi:enoyl-CoA hydratase/carnithine racemase